MVGATERWVEVEGILRPKYGNEVVCNLFSNEKEFNSWASTSPRTWDIHPDILKIEEALFKVTRQKYKLYRLTRMEYVGFLMI